MSQYIPPTFKKEAFACPICGVYSNQLWYEAYYYSGYAKIVNETLFVFCTHCNKPSIWIKEKMVYPFSGTAPLPNPDMPKDVMKDYNEARDIVSISPRGAAALLRLAIQKLCKHLGGAGDNINNDIKHLVENGLPKKLQQALDSVRVVGNNAVHPGQIDISDNVEIANKLFVFINIICQNQITEPKQIDEFYNTEIPENFRDAIDKRDSR